jgi:hypothetical protein
VELESEKEELARRGLGLAAISHDPRSITEPFAEAKGITYPLLSDSGSVVIDRYGILNTELEPDHRRYGIPYPGTFVLDAEGRVVERYFEESYRTRMTGNTLVLRLGGEGDAPSSGSQVMNEYLEAEVYSPDRAVAPGQEFTLVVDVTANPGIHVYAPGDHPYGAIRLGVQEDSLFTAGNAIYPPAEDFHFEPLDEHVPVFTGTFRILQPVVLEASRELSERSKDPRATVTVRGTLEFQACDDKVCFLPVSVPISLDLGLRPLESGVSR